MLDKARTYIELRLDDGSCLVTDVNSLRRRDAVIGLLEEILPGVAVSSEHRVPVARVRATEAEVSLAKTFESILGGVPASDGGDDGDGDDDVGEDDAHDAMQEAAAALRADLDRRWLDHAVPALGDRTPREAAAGNDEERADLRTLLVELETADGAEVTEYRKALGLPRAAPLPAP